jgi:uncharacterized 2Fe-2S/4Fe-4S cluster protein (DUF4445 family)
MPKIFVNGSSKAIEYLPGQNLLQILHDNDIFIENPCNGKGSCGKCKVKITEGSPGEIPEAEKKFLNESEIKEGVRLSCLIHPESDLVIETLHKEREHKILTTGYMPEFNLSPSISKKLFEIEKPSLENQISFEDAILKSLSLDEVDFDVLKMIEPFDGAATAVFDKDKVIAIEKGNTLDNIYGLAIDIGTTTVAADLVDMNSGKAILSSSDINPQKKFGLDVLTRITYALENEEQATKNLQHEIVSLINKMTFEMCMSANISKEHIYEVSVAANTTMLHFLLGIKANSIGKSPYAPVFVKSKYIKASSIGININSNGKLYCLPGVSSYIGSDIVAGAYVAKLHDSKDNILFIDIGTNGEIVLASKGKLLSCSCAAGPALEGMNISCGMRAATGAIEDMVIDEEQVKLSVIGEQQPIGICGSGILAALRELLKTEIVKKDGSFIKKEKLAEDDYRQKYIRLNGKKREFMIEDKAQTLYITQSDIRQIQLAKGAILSGFYALLNKSGISINELDKVVIAGQFGSHLSVDSLTGTGILPKEVENKITYVGNSSKTGAYMALMSDDIKKDLEKIAKTIDYMELGASEGYERLFADCLLF